MKEEKKSKVKLELFPLTSTPKLIISENLKREIDFLHDKIGKTEWSGELITSEKGSIENPETWEIKGENIYLADIGSPGYTEYELNKSAFKSENVVEIYDKFPLLLEGKQKLQHIHSHHNMNAFFSATDMENLQDRAEVSNYLLMLIVNFDGNYKAKVAFKGKVKGEKSGIIEFSNNADKLKEIPLQEPKDREVLITMDCSIVFEGRDVSEDFSDRVKAVVKYKMEEEAERKKKEEAKKNLPVYKGGSVPMYTNDLPWEKNRGKGKRKEEKKVHNMTEKEWNKYQGKFEWERKHFHLLLNAVIDREVKADFEPSVFRLQKESETILTELQMEEFCASFEAGLREYFDILYPGKDDDDFANLMEVGMDILEPYTDNNKLTEEIFQIIWEEAFTADEKSQIATETYPQGFGYWED